MKKVIFLLLDGARCDILNTLLTQDELPNLKGLISNGSYVEATSVFPSTTGPAYSPFLIGRFPGHVNLPGIRWFNKSSYSRNKFGYESHRSYVGLESKFFNQDLKKAYKTIFELIPNSVSIFNEMTRGLKAYRDLTKYSKIFYKLSSHFTGSSSIDKAAFNKLEKSLKRNNTFHFCCLYGIDSKSHLVGSDSAEVVKLYKEFDTSLGKLIANLKLNKSYDDTLILISSDHGHSNTSKHFDLVNFIQSKGKSVFHYPMIHQKIYKDFDAAVMVSGNSMAHIYLKNGDSWSHPYVQNDHNNIINGLLLHDAIDIVLSKNLKGGVNIISRNGKAIVKDQESSIYYQPLENDPFNYSLPEGHYTYNDILERTFNTTYPDSLTQILQLFNSNRCGDIVVSASNGWDLRDKFEYPEHKSSHGSLMAQHIKVPLISNRKITSKAIARTVDVFPTILDFLNISAVNKIDGRSLNIY